MAQSLAQSLAQAHIGQRPRDFGRQVGLGAPALRDGLAYWRAQLQGIEPLELPADRPRAAERDVSGSGVPVQLTGERAAAEVLVALQAPG